MRAKTILIYLLLFFAFSCKGQSEKDNVIFYENSKASELFPKATGWVNDFENILNENEKKELTNICDTFTNRTGIQLAIITISKIDEEHSFFEYSVALGDYWGVNGVMIVVSKNLRQMRINTSYLTENILKDEECKLIIDNTMVPEFKNDNFYLGIKKGLIEVIKDLDQSFK